jgi:hypothetical protein
MVMSEEGMLEEKIPDARLRRIAEEGSEEEASVIIVLDLPEQHIEIGKIELGDSSYPFPSSVLPQAAEERREIEEKAMQARGFLEAILGVTPNELKMARAFVASANGMQLREIASSPLIKSILLNRTLK